MSGGTERGHVAAISGHDGIEVHLGEGVAALFEGRPEPAQPAADHEGDVAELHVGRPARPDRIALGKGHLFRVQAR